MTAKYHTSDKTIRTTLIRELQEKYSQDQDTAIIPEFTLPHGSARVDIAVINGVMHGYELKSDIDNLLRLTSQMGAYNLIFDKVTLVVGKSHLVDALRLIPEWWGITVAKDIDSEFEPILIPVRTARHNPDQDILTIANILWKDEAIAILDNLGEAKNLGSKPKTFICQKLIDTLSEHDLKKHVKKSLISRMSNSCYRPVLG